MPRRSAFSLTELLVVLTIIALLASILMPVVKAVRDAANRVQCMAHLRQCGLAVQSYLGDNRGWYPTSRQDIYSGNVFWFEKLLTYAEAFDRNHDGRLDDADLASGRNILKGCPGFKPDATDVGHGYLGFGFNGCLRMAEDKRRSWWNIQAGIAFYLDYNQLRVSHASQRTLVADSPGWHVTVDNDKYSTSWAPNRHRANANYLACDGHAAALRPDQGRLSIADPTKIE